MPNHVTNIITFNGPKKDVEKMLAFVESEESEFDFNKLIPQPDNMFQGNLGEKELQYCRDNGIPDWYNWNVNNWGTKWNAYDVEVNEHSIRFYTAWAHPFPIINALAEKFPTITFEIKYADEDIGRNLGHYSRKGAMTTDLYKGEGNYSEEDQRFACEVIGYDYDEYFAEMNE